MFRYKTHGTCSTEIDLEIDASGVITACDIINGCRGNTKGLSKMVVGRKADEVKELLRGIPCRGNTSCPDQLSRAIEAYEREVG
ncbi:MAG: TIGR03905 family TSCPD domain-containing protein [Clostridia bacterium]|nr:TIGR03905 family TSCPD domain-containing protein [Clostridia bacterium]